MEKDWKKIYLELICSTELSESELEEAFKIKYSIR